MMLLLLLFWFSLSLALPFGKVHRQPAGSLVDPPLVSVVASSILPFPLPLPPPLPSHPDTWFVLLLCQQAAGVSGSQLCCPHVPKAVDVFHSQTCCWMTLVNARLGRKEAGMLR